MTSLEKYLQEEYLSLSQLSQESNITVERILELEDSQCIPGHSYETTKTITIYCQLKGSYTDNANIERFYNPSILSWLLKAEKLATTFSLNQIAENLKNNFKKEFNKLFNNRQTPGFKGFNNAWCYLMNGTWGICLKEISVDCMARKELSRLRVSQLVKMGDPVVCEFHVKQL